MMVLASPFQRMGLWVLLREGGMGYIPATLEVELTIKNPVFVKESFKTP